LSDHGLDAELAEAAEHVRALRQHVVNFNLESLAEHAFRCETVSQGLLSRLESLGARAAYIRGSGPEVVEGVVASIVAHAKSDDAGAFFSDVVANLDEETAARFGADFEALGQGRVAGNQALSLFRQLSAAAVPVYREEAHQALAGLARATLAGVFVEFEKGTRDAVAKVGQRQTGLYTQMLRTEQAALLGAVDADLLALHRECSLGGDVVDAARRAERTLASRLNSFARLQGFAYRSTVVARRLGRGGKAEVLGAALAESGLATRQCVALRIAVARLVVETASGAPSKTVRLLVESARGRGFEAREESFGRKVQIPKLSEQEDGAEVSIGGFVAATRVTRKDTGPLSVVALQDPSSGTAAMVAAFFAHLPHAGLSKGAFLRVRGSYRKSSDMLAGRAGVEVRRLSLAELGERSWRTELMRTSRRWFQPYRGSLDLAWGLGRHGEALDRRGAAELVYSPTDRSQS
jgi:hypothetical protein